MNELTEMAAQYAAENANQMMADVIAKAYGDGYRDGYNDREDGTSVDLSETEFIDLGLPSGTLWAKDFEQEEGKFIYLPYGEACKLNIPTIDEWEELREKCRWDVESYLADEVHCEIRCVKCVGPNGNFLIFNCTGKKEIDKVSCVDEVFFWIVDKEEEEDYKDAIHIYNASSFSRTMSQKYSISKFFSGYKLPIRLVRKK